MTVSFVELLTFSFLGTLFAAALGLMRGRLSERLSLGLLALCSLAGTVVGAAVTSGVVGPVVLPFFSSAFPVFFGMPLGLDRLSGLFFFFANAVVMVIVIFSMKYLEKFAYLYHLRLMAFLISLLVFGIQGILLSTAPVGYIFFIQVVTLSTFLLIMSGASKEARSAAMLFFAVLEISGAALMGSLFLLADGRFFETFASIAANVPGLPVPILTIALVLALLGFAGQAGLVPFAPWLPNVFEHAPTHVTAVIAGVHVNIAMYGFLRIVLFLMGNPLPGFAFALFAVGMLTAVIGALSAAVESHIKKLLSFDMLAYTGIAVSLIGVAIMAQAEGFPGLSEITLLVSLLLLFSQAVTRAGLVLAGGILTYETHSGSLEAMGGLARKMPVFSILVCLLILLSAAFPPSAPFMAFWMFIEASLMSLPEVGGVFATMLILFIAVAAFVQGLNLFTALKLFGISFLGRARSLGAENAKEPIWSLLAPIFLLTVISLALGLLSPYFTTFLGGREYAGKLTDFSMVLRVGEGEIAPLVFLAALMAAVGGTYLLRILSTNPLHERMQAPWNGGHPVTPRMEYTATAFASPIRYFFQFILKTQSRKAVTVTPLLSTNPWFANKNFSMNIEPVWERLLYAPLKRLMAVISQALRRLQSGNVQVYVAMILVTLITCIIFAL